MDTKWKKSKSIIGFLAFLLGVSLLLEGVCFFGVNLTSSSGRQWIQDSMKSDFRNTREFKDFVCNRLERLITMGAGGYVYGDIHYYDGGEWDLRETRARSLHNAMREDRNILYTVEREGEILYSNDGAVGAAVQPGGLPEGYEDYSFFLQFDGAKVRVWQDGKELNIYGDGYYRYESIEDLYQWHVPGYKNFMVDEAGSRVRVTMAVLNTPRIFIKGNYGQSGPDEYNQLYYLKLNLEQCRDSVVGHAVRAGVGLVLLAVYVLLRKDKGRADQAIAGVTGRVWFEIKVLAAALLVFFFLPRPAYLGDVWTDLVYSYGAPAWGTTTPSSSAASEAILYNGDIAAELEQQGIDYREWLIEQGLSYTNYEVPRAYAVGNTVTILSENGGWLLREYLREIADHFNQVLILFWGLYLLAVNDWRYNTRPWRRGVLAFLYAGELKYPIQKRLRQQVRGLALALILLGGLAAGMFFMTCLVLNPPLWFLLLIEVPYALAAGLAVLILGRQRKLWAGLGQVADQLSAVRTGTLERELTFPPEDDLYQMADDLNHIRQGLHQAVEDRTQSERMKVELVTNVSHDLKTPLTSILSYTELLAQEPLEPPASEYVKIMGEKAQRLKAMVQDVFEVSKAASGQLPVNLKELDYARLLRQTLADMAQAIEVSGLTLRTSIPEEAVPILADSDRLYRVFQNLIGNALKYSLPGSRVYLSLQVEGNAAAASVRNTSAAELRPGAEYTARFVRGDASRTDGGSGLGLSIAESFARACGGELTVTTQADLFTALVTFPLAERPE